VKRLLLIGVVAAAVAAPAASATNECKGLKVCVPVAGPWVLTPAAGRVEYDLTCPKSYIVAGLDAELSVRGIEIGFVGGLGSPVNPGITTQRDALFLGRLIRGSTPASFRPHVGCVPASGGGQRVPTAAHAFPPAKPTARTVRQVAATRNRTVRARCSKADRLQSATFAVGFYGNTPPTAAQAHGIRVVQRVRNGIATYAITSHVKAVLQIDLVCVPR
jgi:hypothetical protein